LNYWQHARSTERDFIYVTTQHLTSEQLAQLSDEVGPERTLLVLCAAFRAGTRDLTERYPNLTVKKIPKQVLARCEWGHDNYSLKVENLPKAPPKPGQMDLIEPPWIMARQASTETSAKKGATVPKWK
jgi:adenine-specific DNA-methyltransferase